MTERSNDPAASDLEGGGTEQTWGQGQGRHEPTVTPDEPSDDVGPATGQAEASASDEREGMDR